VIWPLVGGQFRLSTGSVQSRSDAAFQAISGRGITDNAGFGSVQDTQAAFGAAAWEGKAPWSETIAPGSAQQVSERQGGLRLQVNALRSTSSREADALGLWADAAWRTERWRNTAGIFRFEPNLRWGTAVLASDLQGMYWQGDTSTRQWRAGFATEITDSVKSPMPGSASTGRSAFLNLNGSYHPQFDRRGTESARHQQPWTGIAAELGTRKRLGTDPVAWRLCQHGRQSQHPPWH
jgi:hypothetical protein